MLERGGRSWSMVKDRWAQSNDADPDRLVGRLRGQDAVAVLDSSPDAVVGLDSFARVVFANGMSEQTFGRSRRELLQTPVDTLVPHLARAVNALRLRVLAGDDVVGPAGPGTELAGVRADGTRFPATVWLTPVRSGRNLVVTATVRDLTGRRSADAQARSQAADLTRARQQTAVSRQEVAAILRAVSERVIILADPHGVITAFNRGAERLLGYTAAQIIGSSTTRLSDPEELAAVGAELGIDAGLDPLLELTRSGLPNVQDWSYVSATGQRCPVTLRITAIGDRSDLTGFVLVADEKVFDWTPSASGTAPVDRLLLDLDDAETRAQRWQVGGTRYARRG